VAGARTLPWSWYDDPQQLRLERERIFRGSWQYVGHVGEVPEPGTFAAADAGGVPVVLVRDADGDLRGFLNVCRHRGHVVAAGNGRRLTLQCRYHGWTYGLDGALRAAPRAERELGEERAELGLVPVAVDAWGPFVFINTNFDASSLAEALGDVPERVASAGIDVGALAFRLRARSEVAANWKVVCENYLECYHCPVAHPGFSARFDVSQERYVLADGGRVLSQAAPLRGTEDGEVVRGEFHFVWPNLVINVYAGRPNLALGPVVPVAPDRSARFLDYFFAPDADEEWVEELLAFDDQVGREDVALVESVQRGVSTGLVEHGRLLAESERLVARFQQLVREAVTADRV